MSPEQASGQALDPRSDIYSLGIVLFELFTGIRPFAAQHVAAVIYRQLHDEPPWSAPRAAALPAELQALVRRALAKSRDDRFASASELRRALEASRGASTTISGAETLVVRVQAAGVAFSGTPALPGSAAPVAASAGEAPAKHHRVWISRRTFVSLAVVILAFTAMVTAAVVAWRIGRSANVPTGPPVSERPAVAPNTNRAEQPGPVAPERPRTQPARPTTIEATPEARCERGEAAACFAAAQQLETGASVPKDLPRAVALYGRACDGAVAAACTQLGVLQNSGVGGVRDLGLAGALYERGCKLGDMSGCNNLGTLYQFGSLGFRDRGRAEALYQKACGAAHAEACTNLALIYLDDSNVSADRRARARGLLTKACADGVSRACQKLDH